VTTHDHLREAWSRYSKLSTEALTSEASLLLSFRFWFANDIIWMSKMALTGCYAFMKHVVTLLNVLYLVSTDRFCTYLGILHSWRIRRPLFAGPAVSRDYSQCYCHVIVVPAKKFNIFVGLLDDNIIVYCTRAVDVIIKVFFLLLLRSTVFIQNNFKLIKS